MVDATTVVLACGATVELESRTCIGGCGRVFRCLPSSEARYARAYCGAQCHGQPLTRLQRRDLHALRAPLPRLMLFHDGGRPVPYGPIPPAAPWRTPAPRPPGAAEGPICAPSGPSPGA